MKRLVGLIVFVLLCGEVAGQENKKFTAKEAEERWEYLYDLAYKWFDNDNHLSLCYVDSMKSLALFSKDLHMMARAHIYRGQLLRRIGEIDSSRIEYQRAMSLSITNNLTREYAIVLNGLALIETYVGDFEKALKINMECLVIREKEGNCEEIASTLINIGFVYLILENHETALQYFRRVIELPEHVQSLDIAMINAGVSFAHLQQYESAIDYLQKGIGACSGNCSNDNLAAAFWGFGLVGFNLGNLKDSECNFLEAAKYAERAGEKRLLAEALLSLSRVYLKLGRTKLALDYLKKCEVIIQNSKLETQLLQLYEDYIAIYISLDRPLELKVYQEKHERLRKKFFNHDVTRGILNIHSKLSERQNNLLIKYQSEILELREDSLRKHRSINVLVTTAAILLIVVSFLLYRLTLIKEREKKLLDEKVRERTIALEASLIRIRMTEDQNRMLLVRASHEISSAISSAEGLVNLAVSDKEMSRQTSVYYEEWVKFLARLGRVKTHLKPIN